MQKPHHEIVSEFNRHLDQGRNPADIFHELNLPNRIPADSLPLILHRALVHKRTYSFLSFNLPDTAPHWQSLLTLLKPMDGFDSVVAYYYSEQELLLINPREADHWKNAAPLLPGSLMVIYTQAQPVRNLEAEKQFLAKFQSFCEQPPDTDPADPLESPVENRLPVRETPRYAVPVTNEFFHYGNVEAWRNIIDHYQEKHPNLKVRVFHKDKPIHRIGTLFKWGKVSVGDVIQFSVTGPEFKNVAKLKKYLSIGASPRYSPFIKKRLNDSLNLF